MSISQGHSNHGYVFHSSSRTWWAPNNAQEILSGLLMSIWSTQFAEKHMKSQTWQRFSPQWSNLHGYQDISVSLRISHQPYTQMKWARALFLPWSIGNNFSSCLFFEKFRFMAKKGNCNARPTCFSISTARGKKYKNGPCKKVETLALVENLAISLINPVTSLNMLFIRRGQWKFFKFSYLPSRS